MPGIDERDYSALCRKATVAYIERFTRFEAVDIAIAEAKAETVAFTVRAHYLLRANTVDSTVQGKLPAEAGDIVAASESEYAVAIRERERAETARRETLDELAETVRNAPFAAITDSRMVRTHPGRILFAYACHACNGRGHRTCNTCNGRGKERCPSCVGSGRIACRACHGSGRIGETVTVRDAQGNERRETRYRPCYQCTGGHVDCPACHGSGERTCGTCGGSGHVRCGNCDGTGFFTRIARTETHVHPHFAPTFDAATPEHVGKAIAKIGVQHIASVGRIAFERVDIDYEGAAADFHYRAAVPFGRLAVEILGHRSQWVLYGDKVRVYDAGGALEVLLRDDLAALGALDAKMLWRDPRSYRLAEPAVGTFMQSEINQKLVEADREGQDPQAILDGIDYAVSPGYIDAALAGLTGAIKPASVWSRAKAVLACIAAAPLAFLIGFAVLASGHLGPVAVENGRYILFDASDPSAFVLLALFSLAIAGAGGFVARLIAHRWLVRVGGKRLTAWADRKGLSIGYATIAAIALAIMLLTGALFARWPIWIDRDGALYGLIGVTEAMK